MDRKQKRLGQILLEKGLITARQLELALDEQKKNREFLGKILIEDRLIEEKGLLEALSEQFSLPLASLKDKYLDWTLIRQFSPSLILDHRCFPLSRDEESVTIAINNPLDAWALEKAEREASGLGLRLKLVLASSDDIGEAVRRYQEYTRGSISKLLE